MVRDTSKEIYNKRVKDIAIKYVHGNHDALTDNQEVLDMTLDIAKLLNDQKELNDGVVKALETTFNNALKVKNYVISRKNKEIKESIEWAAKFVAKAEVTKLKEVLKLVLNSQLENNLCMYYVLPTEVYEQVESILKEDD